MVSAQDYWYFKMHGKQFLSQRHNCYDSEEQNCHSVLPIFLTFIAYRDLSSSCRIIRRKEGGQPTTELCFIYANCCIWLGKWCPIGSFGQHIIAWLMAVELAVWGRLQWVEENRCSLTVGAECHPRLATTSGEGGANRRALLTPSFLLWLLWL